MHTLQQWPPEERVAGAYVRFREKNHLVKVTEMDAEQLAPSYADGPVPGFPGGATYGRVGSRAPQTAPTRVCRVANRKRPGKLSAKPSRPGRRCVYPLWVDSRGSGYPEGTLVSNKETSGIRPRRLNVHITEWTGEKGAKQPHLFTAADGSPLLAFAGLWDRCRDQ